VFNNDVLVTRYQPYTGALPVVLNSDGGFNALLKGTVLDVMEDLKFTGAIRLPLINTAGASQVYAPGGNGFQVSNGSLFDAGGEWYARFDYLKKRFDYSALYYRQTQVGTQDVGGGNFYGAKMYTNLYQGIVKYPFDKVRSIRFSVGYRTDKTVIRAEPDGNNFSITAPDIKQAFLLTHVEYVYDNTVMPTTDIYKGLRYKIYFDLNTEMSKGNTDGKNGMNAGFDGRYYYPIFRNFIWAAHVGGDFSWADQKIIYYLGGSDGWMFPKANTANQPQGDYAYQALAVNMRGYDQNVSNGNNAVVINSEFRLPVFTTFFNKPINNAFLRNFMVTQFIDLGSAWNGQAGGIQRPYVIYNDPNNPAVSVNIKAGGIGPFVGGYGFGVRSTLLGYFLKLDAGWPMGGFFQGKPIYYFGMGLDF
jgi:hypothetical protein